MSEPEYNSVLFSRGGEIFERHEVLYPDIDNSPYLQDRIIEFESDVGIGAGHSSIFGFSGITLAESKLIKEIPAKSFGPFNEFLMWHELNYMTEKTHPGAKAEYMRDKQRWARKAFLKRPEGISKSEWAHGIRKVIANLFPGAYNKFVGMRISGENEGPVSMGELGEFIIDYKDEKFKAEFEHLAGLPIFEADDTTGIGSIEHEYKKTMFDLYKFGVFGRKNEEQIDTTEERTFQSLGDLGYIWISRHKTPDPKTYRRVIKTKSKSRAREVAKAHEKKGYRAIIAGKQKGKRKGSYRVFIPRKFEGKETRAFKVKKKEKGINLGKTFKAVSEKVVGGAKYVANKVKKGAEWVAKKIKEGLAWIAKKLKEVWDTLNKWGGAIRDLTKNWEKAKKRRKSAAQQKAKNEEIFNKLNKKMKRMSAAGMGSLSISYLFEDPLILLDPAKKKKVLKCKRGRLVTHKGKKQCVIAGKKKLKKAYLDKFNAKLKMHKKTNEKFKKDDDKYKKQVKKAGDKLGKGKKEAGKARNDIKRLHGEKKKVRAQRGTIQLGIVVSTAALITIIAVLITIGLIFKSLSGSFGSDQEMYADSEMYYPDADEDYYPGEEFEDPSYEWEEYEVPEEEYPAIPEEEYPAIPEEEVEPRLPEDLRPPKDLRPKFRPPVRRERPGPPMREERVRREPVYRRPPPEPPEEEEPEYVEEYDEDAYEYYEPEYDEDFEDEDEYEPVEY